MRPGADKRHWEQMFKSLTDPDEREKAKREADKKRRIDDKVSDTGL